MEIRHAGSKDLAAIPAIEVAAGRRFLDVGMPEIAADAPPTVAELQAAELVLVAEVDGVVVGYAQVEVVGDTPHLEQLSVIPEIHGRGVGSALIETACSWAADRSDAITLTTFRDVPFNAPYYARRGFEVVPAASWSPAITRLVEEEAAHGLDPSTRVVMRRRLRRDGNLGNVEP